MSKYEIICVFTYGGLFLYLYLLVSSYLVETNIWRSLALKLKVLSFIWHLDLHLPRRSDGYALVTQVSYLNENISAATLLSWVRVKVLCLEPRANVIVCLLDESGFHIYLPQSCLVSDHREAKR